MIGHLIWRDQILMKTVALALFFFLSHSVLAQKTPNPQPKQTWNLSTDKMQRIVVLEDGRFFTQSWIDRSTGRNLLGGMKVNELAVVIDGKEVTGIDGGWSLVANRDNRQKDGSVELDLTLRRGDLEATKHYVTYPGSSIIREWVTFKNMGTGNLTIADPRFLCAATRLGHFNSLDFHWMTGGKIGLDHGY